MFGPLASLLPIDCALHHCQMTGVIEVVVILSLAFAIPRPGAGAVSVGERDNMIHVQTAGVDEGLPGVWTDPPSGGYAALSIGPIAYWFSGLLS